MKSVFAIIILFIGIPMCSNAQVPSDKILGKWWNEDYTVQSEIYKKGDTYEAKITEGKAYVGKITLYNLQFNGKVWEGMAVQPKSGRTADAVLKLENNDTLVITAYLAGISRTKNWYRVK